MTKEEAIKVAYGIPVTKAQHEALQFLIPELTESEDERIMEELIGHCKDLVRMNKEDKVLLSIYEPWLAYLEKQKESKKEFHIPSYIGIAHYNPVPIEQKEDKDELVYRLNGLMQDYIKEGKDDEEKEHRLKCYQLFWDALEDTNFFEQKEQKPTDKIDLKFNIGDTIINKKNGEKCTISNRCLLHQYYSDTNHCHEIKFDEQDDWELVKEQKQTDLPAGFYYIDLNGNRYYSKEFRYGDMKLKVGEQKPVLTAKEAWKEMRLEVYAQASGNRHEPNYSDDSTKMFSLCDIDEIFEKIGDSTVGSLPAEWSEEDKEMLECVIMDVEKAKENYLKSTTQVVQQGAIIADKELAWLKSLHPQPREEIYQSAKHDLAIKFMNYLDENRPEGKMSLSNGECEDIDKAFKENDWAKIMRYVEKYSPQLKQDWSEEDRLHYVNVLEALEYVKGCKSDYDKIEAVKSDIAWLKSLRPPFKPSED